MAVLVLSLYVAQNAQAVDQYTDFNQHIADSSDNFASAGNDAFGGGDPFDGALGTPDSSSFAAPASAPQTVQAQEAKMDAELSDAGGNDFLYPASSGMQTPDQIENASSYANEVTSPPSYPRSEPPAKRYEKSSKKKKSWAKKSKKSKNKYAKKSKHKKGKKFAKNKRKKNSRISRNDT